MIVNKPKSKILVEDTIAYQRTIIESQIFDDKVQTIFDEINKENTNKLIRGNVVEKLNFFDDYEPVIKETFRNHIEKIYRIGSEYVTSSLHKQPFYTVKDISNIVSITDKSIESFKKIIEKNLLRNRDISYSDIQQELYDQINLEIQGNFGITKNNPIQILQSNITKPKPLSPKKQIKNHIETTSFLSMNVATMEKAKQVIDQINIPLFFKGQPEDAVLQRFARQQILPAIVWVTKRDEMVCPICRPMNGLIFRMDDLNIPIPPIFSHSNCRCRIFLFNLSSNQTLVDLSV